MEWFWSAPVTGFLAWLGTLAGLVGLAFTYVQVVRARRSAEAAAAAAQSATAALEGRFSLSDAAYSVAQLDVVKGLVHDGYPRPAQQVFAPVKRMVLGLCHVPSGVATGQEIERAQAALRAVDHQLDLGVAAESAYNKWVLLRALNALAEFLTWRENDLKLDWRNI